jgi:GntR family transcriptional regulator, transcriptional repressor for pyruvate dehydrogenase complex
VPAKARPETVEAAKSSIRPLQRRNLVRDMSEQLRKEILTGCFASTETLPTEGRLCEVFGVSRTVVREAIRSLQAQGLIEVSQGRPPRVKPVDPQSVIETLQTYLHRGNHLLLDLVEVRRPLESGIAALAAERATPQQIEQMRNSIEQMAAARSQNAILAADERFHDLLAEATGNRVFSMLLSVLVDMIRQSRRRTIAKAGLDITVAGHRAILAAVEKRDPDAARKAMLVHLNLAEQALQEGEMVPAPDAGK